MAEQEVLEPQTFQVKEVTPDTAHLVPPLLYSVFGYSYTDDTLYEVAGVVAAVSGGNQIIFLGMDGSGRARGLLAMRFSFPSTALAELGMLLVDPELPVPQSGKLLQMLGGRLTREAHTLARTRGLRGLISTEVTVHTMTQRLVQRFGFVSTGIYLGWAPSWAERLRAPPSERLRGSAMSRRRQEPGCERRRTETVSALPFDKMVQPYAIALPTRFAACLRTVYKKLGLPVTFVPAVPARGRSAVVEQLSLRRSRVLVELTDVGSDAPGLLLERLAHYRDGMVDLIHFALPLRTPDLDPSVETLVAAGCRYAALIPLFRGDDVLVIQYLNQVEVDLTENDLHCELARMLFRELIA